MSFSLGKKEKPSMICQRCGECCRKVRVYQPLDNEQVKWWKYHGISPKWKIENFYAIDFPIRCVQLVGDNKCGIYEDRPQPCREFDCSLMEYKDFKECS